MCVFRYRRAVGYDTSLAWDDFSANTEGLMATVLNDLVDLNRGQPTEDHSLFRVTLNAGCEWRPFGTDVVIANVVPLADAGINFTVARAAAVNSNSYGVLCA